MIKGGEVENSGAGSYFLSSEEFDCFRISYIRGNDSKIRENHLFSEMMMISTKKIDFTLKLTHFIRISAFQQLFRLAMMTSNVQSDEKCHKTEFVFTQSFSPREYAS